MRYQARSNVVAVHESMFVKINNDATAANYTISPYVIGANTTTTAGTFAAAVTNACFVNNITGTSGSPASETGDGVMRINNYSGTTWHKHMSHNGAYVTTTGTGQETVIMNSGVWKNTAAINRLTFNVPTSFVNGSVFTLYGVGAP